MQMELHEMYAEIQKNLGICLTAKELAQELRINYVAALALMDSEGFPTVQFSERNKRVPRKELIQWLSEKAVKV